MRVLGRLQARVCGCLLMAVGACGDDAASGGTDGGTETDTDEPGTATGTTTTATGGSDPSSTGSDSDGSATDTTTGVPPAGPPTQLVPLGVQVGAGLVDGAWSNTLESDQYRLANARFGAASQNVAGNVAGTMYRLSAWLPGVGASTGTGIPVAGTLTSGGGTPLHFPDGLIIQITGYADAAASEELFMEDVSVAVIHGTFVGWLPASAEAALGERGEAWLGFEVASDVLVPLIRVGATPHAIAAHAFAAGGLDSASGNLLPVEAYESSVEVVEGTYRPGDTVTGLPVGEDWHCRHWTTVLGYPRSEGRREAETVCQCVLPLCGSIDCSDVLPANVWKGTLQLATAAVGRAAVHILPPRQDWHTLGHTCPESPTADCDPIVMVARREIEFGSTCSGVPPPTNTCASIPRRIVLGGGSTPAVTFFDEDTDAGASDLHVRVVSVCTKQGGD